MPSPPVRVYTRWFCNRVLWCFWGLCQIEQKRRLGWVSPDKVPVWTGTETRKVWRIRLLRKRGV
jgi:hypothetical protein